MFTFQFGYIGDVSLDENSPVGAELSLQLPHCFLTLARVQVANSHMLK
jgi:hypothetical protein